MESLMEYGATRKQIGIRLLYTLMYLVIFEILKIIVQVTVLFQFLYLLITREHSRPLRSFSNKVAAYAYRIIRYMTLNENERPFPFAEFPSEMEPSQETVSFGK